MKDLLIRCSAVGKIMTQPRTKGEGILSVGAKTHIRGLASQDIFGVDFEISSKEMEKGILVEDDAIQMLNRVRGLSLDKNKERKKNAWVTGEADLFDVANNRGHDIKCPWSIATFPICVADCYNIIYEWQMRAYMWLWDADEWEVNYALISTPEHLAKWEPASMHFVDHISEHLRITTWHLTRDKGKEEEMKEKIEAARDYYRSVIEEFNNSHKEA